VPHVSLDPLALTPFLLLLFAVVGLWIHRYVWQTALAAAVVAAYFTGALRGFAVCWILILGAMAVLYRWRSAHAELPYFRQQRVVTGLAFFGFALAMGLALFPGFPRTVLVDGVILSPGAAAYNLDLGFHKVVAGIFILGFIHEERVRSWRELGGILRSAAPVLLVTIIAVMAVALAMGYVRFDPRWSALFLVWAPSNLLFTCLSEEAFFRGFVQRELAKIGKNRQVAAMVALGVAAILFGLAHFGGGWQYICAATVAGLGYGWAYHRTQRVEAAMAVHFGVNAVHFLLFTYPRLAT
jgi:membrane protease YdiL (CAAX protease family)